MIEWLPNGIIMYEQSQWIMIWIIWKSRFILFGPGLAWSQHIRENEYV